MRSTINQASDLRYILIDLIICSHSQQQLLIRTNTKTKHIKTSTIMVSYTKSLLIFSTLVVAAMSSDEVTRAPLATREPEPIVSDYDVPTEAPTNKPRGNGKNKKPRGHNNDAPPGRWLRGAATSGGATIAPTTRAPLETRAPEPIVSDYELPQETEDPRGTKPPEPIVSDYDVPPGRSLRAGRLQQ